MRIAVSRVGFRNLTLPERRSLSTSPWDLRVKEGLRPRIAPAKIVLLHQMLMKMLGRETRVTRAIQRLHLIAPVRRNPLARGLTQPPIKLASFALILKTLTPAPHRPLANPQ